MTAADASTLAYVAAALPISVFRVDEVGRVLEVIRADRFAAGATTADWIWDRLAGTSPREQYEQALRSLAAGRAQMLQWDVTTSLDEFPGGGRALLISMAAAPSADPGGGFFVTALDVTSSRRAREALVEASLRLSRTIDLDRVYREVVRLARRAVACSDLAIAIADDETSALRIVHRAGYDRPKADDVALQRRLMPLWLDALANEHQVIERIGDRIEITAPLSSTEGVLGAMTLVVEPGEGLAGIEDAQRSITLLAAQTSAAIERSWLVQRVSTKRRFEAIGEVATGIAHEIRNPLFGISSAAQMLRVRVPNDPSVLRTVTRILGEVDRLNSMVTALLDFGRPQAPALTPGDPDRIWDDVLEGERARLALKRQTLVRTMSPEGVLVAIQPAQLAQVFLNLLVNASDAAPEAGVITLGSHVLPTGGWRVRLHNGGPAIPAEVLPHVFELFYSTKSGGTGIGLALCQRILDDHGGTISIESVPERGTTVTVSLPPMSAEQSGAA
jgi:signal transduction histidine kinase